MNQAMCGSASIPIDGGMIVIGGYDGNNALKSSQIIFSNGSVITDGPELPEPRLGHCLAYDKEEDVFFITGAVMPFKFQYQMGNSMEIQR